MTTTEEDVSVLYRDLKGETFVGEYVKDFESMVSRRPQLRQVIASKQLEQKLEMKLKDIQTRLEGQVWKGFRYDEDRSSWEFYATLDGEHCIGEYGLSTIRDFEVFHLKDSYAYESQLGVSISVTMENKFKEQLNDLGILQQPPTLALVKELAVPRIASKWFNVGTWCGVRSEALSVIERENAGDPIKCCLQMFIFWLYKEPETEYHPKTWDTLLAAVKKAHGVQTYENIMRALIASIEEAETDGGAALSPYPHPTGIGAALSSSATIVADLSRTKPLPSSDNDTKCNGKSRQSIDGPPPAKKHRTNNSSQVQVILKKYEDAFFEDVNAKHNLLRLKRKGVISEDVVAVIEAKRDEEANEVLYDHLINHGTLDTLREWCEWAETAKGYPKMQELGREMKDELKLAIA